MVKRRLETLISLVLISLLAPTGAWGYTWFVNPNTNHYYATTLTNETWEQAEAEAILAGGHLVTINDADEEGWLREKFDKFYTYWIGFTDRQQEGVWIWASGESVNHTNWAAAEPNNLNPNTVGPEWQSYYTANGEDYAVMNWLINGVAFWNDVPNLGPWFAQNGGGVTGIIEVTRVNAPLPSTLLLLGSVLPVLIWRKSARI